MNSKHLALVTMATIIGGGTLMAQDTRPPKNTERADQRNVVQTPGDSATKDQTFGHCLATADQEQVLLSRFAKDKAENPAVKAYAETLEKAHQASWEQLKTLYPEIESMTKNAESVANSNKTDANTSTKPNVPVAADRNQKVDFAQLQQEISTQCLADSKTMLGSKSGIEFDQCFLGMQIAKHAAAHSTMTVLQRHTSGKLQALVKENLAMNASHLATAISLMEKLGEIDTQQSSRSQR